MQLPTPPTGPRIRIRANQRDCLIGRNRKARKEFCATIFYGRIIGPVRVPKNPMWKKRLRREARHCQVAAELVESMGSYCK